MWQRAISWLAVLSSPDTFPILALSKRAFEKDENQWYLSGSSPLTVAGAAPVSHRFPAALQRRVLAADFEGVNWAGGPGACDFVGGRRAAHFYLAALSTSRRLSTVRTPGTERTVISMASRKSGSATRPMRCASRSVTVISRRSAGNFISRSLPSTALAISASVKDKFSAMARLSWALSAAPMAETNRSGAMGATIADAPALPSAWRDERCQITHPAASTATRTSAIRTVGRVRRRV